MEMQSKVTRGYAGFPIRHEGNAVNEFGNELTIEWGIADTFFTCPAKTLRNGKSVYGFITYDEGENGESIRTFVEVTDQAEGKRRYRQSIQF